MTVKALGSTTLQCDLSSLVSRPLPFLLSICVHYNTQEQKTGEKQRRPGNIHHVSGCKVDVGGGADIQIYMLQPDFKPLTGL